MPGAWVRSPNSRQEVLEQSLHRALHDAMAMKDASTDGATDALLDSQYDIKLSDMEVAIETFVRFYLDPSGLRSDESPSDIDADSGIVGAFFIGVMTGWRYGALNDHSFKEDAEEEE